MQTTNSIAPCPHCGATHTTTCPKIKAIDYYPNGAVKRVEFKSAQDYPIIPQWQGPFPVTCAGAPLTPHQKNMIKGKFV
jgi:hypothetical protein